MQQVLALSGWVWHILEPKNRALKVQEFLTGPVQNSVATSSELALIYHVSTQIQFKEWLLLRDADIKWYNP